MDKKLILHNLAQMIENTRQPWVLSTLICHDISLVDFIFELKPNNYKLIFRHAIKFMIRDGKLHKFEKTLIKYKHDFIEIYDFEAEFVPRNAKDALVVKKIFDIEPNIKKINFELYDIAETRSCYQDLSNILPNMLVRYIQHVCSTRTIGKVNLDEIRFFLENPTDKMPIYFWANVVEKIEYYDQDIQSKIANYVCDNIDDQFVNKYRTLIDYSSLFQKYCTQDQVSRYRRYISTFIDEPKDLV